MLYAGRGRGILGAKSSQMGPPSFTIIADWLADRAVGKPLEPTFNLVDNTGHMHSELLGKIGSTNTVHS